MHTSPDLNRIGSVVSSWQRGVVTTDEARELIESALEPANHLPAEELVALPQADESMRQVLAIAERVEHKLNLVIQHAGIPLPAPLDPDVLSSEVKQLADKRQKVEAVARHRLATGAGFSETCELINRYLGQRPSPR